MHRIIYLYIFLTIQFIIAQDVYSSSDIQDKGIGKNKSYIISTTMRLGKDSTIEEALEKAYNYSAQTILRRRGGFEIESSTILQEQDNGKFFNQMISVELDGEIKDDKVLEDKVYIKDNDIYIDYKFQFWILKESKKDPYFQINATSDKYECNNGEKLTVSFRSSLDCYLYLYNYLPYEDKIVSIPLSSSALSKKIVNGENWSAKLTAEFADECSNGIQSFEHIYFLAMKKNKDILFSEKSVTYQDFHKKLKSIPRNDYELQMVSYIIKK